VNTCDTCKWWEQTDNDPVIGFCRNEKLVCEMKKETWTPDSFFAGESESYPCAPGTGPKFGCIHHEPK